MIKRLGLSLLLACALPLAAVAQMGPPQDRYIVVLNDGLDLPEDVAADVALRTGGRVGYVYEYVLRGFSIVMPRAALAGVERDPRVAYVDEDKPVSIFAQSIPTGIDRIFASGNDNLDIDGTDDYRVDVDVAVLDTGIDLEHPDLNVAGGTDCTLSNGGGPFGSYYCGDPGEGTGGDDNHYHGTHVAGTIGALDNGIGVVGVAPGARLWAVKVLNHRGSGYTSGIIAGINWVVARGDIEVINMSLGGSGVNTSYETAIDNAVGAGVVVVVAAGNSDADANNYSPAYVASAITVSALADFDGLEGGFGSPTCRDDQDDTLADFSNWGSAVDIAAPGVCILSTYPIEQGEYGTISGTSMAAPHVAGAAALLASGDNSPQVAGDVQAIRDTLVNNGNFNWTDDSGDGNHEPLLDVSNTSMFNPAMVASSGDSGTGGDTGGDEEPTGGPDVTSFTPATLSAGSTANMTILGTGFANGASVSFENGSGPAPSASDISVSSEGTSITGTVTAGSGGPKRPRVWDVRVTNPDGSSDVLTGALTVNP